MARQDRWCRRAPAVRPPERLERSRCRSCDLTPALVFPDRHHARLGLEDAVLQLTHPLHAQVRPFLSDLTAIGGQAPLKAGVFRLQRPDLVLALHLGAAILTLLMGVTQRTLTEHPMIFGSPTSHTIA